MCLIRKLILCQPLRSSMKPCRYTLPYQNSPLKRKKRVLLRQLNLKCCLKHQ